MWQRCMYDDVAMNKAAWFTLYFLRYVLYHYVCVRCFWHNNINFKAKYLPVIYSKPIWELALGNMSTLGLSHHRGGWRDAGSVTRFTFGHVMDFATPSWPCGVLAYSNNLLKRDKLQKFPRGPNCFSRRLQSGPRCVLNKSKFSGPVMPKDGAAMQMISENMGLVDVGAFTSVKGNILSSHIAIDIYLLCLCS